jgi:colicin import membrane protein
MRTFVALLLASAVFGTAAAPASDERARLAAQQQDVERRFAAEQADCAGRFAVSSCMEAARLKRRDTLALLQAQDAELTRRERLASAQRRRDAIRARAAASAARPSEAASAPAAAASRAAQAAPAPPARDPLEALPAPAAGNATRGAQERRALTAYEQRQREAEEHRIKVEQRNAARAASGRKPAVPLPAPASGPAK